MVSVIVESIALAAGILSTVIVGTTVWVLTKLIWAKGTLIGICVNFIKNLGVLENSEGTSTLVFLGRNFFSAELDLFPLT